MSEISQWHSIRPWRPTLSLIVREITSVSATFILSSPLGTDPSATDHSLASLGITNDEDEDFGEETTPSNRRIQIVSDVLSKGLSVKVNGTPWQRVLMKIDDEADEAVIILFGLMPGRQYDVELGIVPNEKTLRSQITTGEYCLTDFVGCFLIVCEPTEQIQNAVESDSHQLSADGSSEPSDQAFIQAATALTPDSSSSLASSQASLSAPPPPSTFSLEDRCIQLNHTLSLLNTEHTQLTGTLKSARRDAQKTDAALRAEIEALKRASERGAPAELRARQKARALQEAARQAQAAAEQVQVQVQELEDALPELQRQRDQLDREWHVVKKDATVVHSRREEAEAREKKRADAKHSELASLTTRLDRLTARREKLDSPDGVINALEEKLRRLEEERERIENDPYGYNFEGSVDSEEEQVANSTRDDSLQPISPIRTHVPSSLHQPRKRHSHPAGQSRQPVSPIARPDPIQRPGRVSLPPPGPGVIHLQPNHSHSQSVPSVKKLPLASSNNGSTSGSSSSPSPAPASASLLSGRAPVFAPRGLKSDLNPTSSPFEPRAGLIAISGLQAKSEGRRKK